MTEEIGQEKVEGMSKEQAVAFVGAMMQECSQLGANSHEIPTLISIREAVIAGTITPAEACSLAKQIRSSKQDYH